MSGSPRDDEIDSLIDEHRSFNDVISPLLADIDCKRINRRMISFNRKMMSTAFAKVIPNIVYLYSPIWS